MQPGRIGEEGVRIHLLPPQPLTGGTVTPTITPDIGTTTRQGPRICPRLESFPYRRLLSYTRPHQGLGMVEATWVAGSGYRYPVWGFRFRFTDTNGADSLRRARHANSFWGRECEPAIRMGRRLIPGEQAIR
jgi:hypothetical protein